MYAVKQDGAFAGYADSVVPICTATAAMCRVRKIKPKDSALRWP